LSMVKPVSFPLYLRVPAWTSQPVIAINGKPVNVKAVPGKYVKIVNEWKNSDVIMLEFPMKITTRVWEKNKNSVSVNYGPLTFSLKIDERYIHFDTKETAQYDSKWQENADPTKWPSFEIQPESAWNFGLLSTSASDKAFSVVRKPWPPDNFPFTLASAPIEIKTKGKKILGWTIDQYGLCAELPQSPVTTETPVEEITLVPMGAARLRISAFPVVK
ncbi:MAG: glycoside hydrolase family 127 protein, partial [Cyclobacteriaceae bacterium]|nr:glycoside hydrolase family 127 protein [Cyclobacteriaceae bacterium]